MEMLIMYQHAHQMTAISRASFRSLVTLIRMGHFLYLRDCRLYFYAIVAHKISACRAFLQSILSLQLRCSHAGDEGLFRQSLSRAYIAFLTRRSLAFHQVDARRQSNNHQRRHCYRFERMPPFISTFIGRRQCRCRCGPDMALFYRSSSLPRCRHH